MNTKFNIGIIKAQFNADITDRLHEGALSILRQHNLTPCFDISVKGAVEIPFAANQLAILKKPDAIIALGAVIFGETDHYHYVSHLASQGCLDAGLKHNIPIGFGILTTKHWQQAFERSGGNKGNAGAEAATAVIDLLQTLTTIS